MMRHSLLWVLLTGCFAAGAARGEVKDPTRPAGLLTTPEVVGAAAAPVESGVQTVILRTRGKSTAVINGQQVALGEMFGGKRVVKIAEDEVVLQGESGREVMKVTPDIAKVPVRKIVPAKRRTTESTQK